MTLKLDHFETNNEVKKEFNLYAVDYLKIEISITHNPNKLSNKIVVPFTKFDDEFHQQQESYGRQWVRGSHNDHIQIKSISENKLLIEGNLSKWLYGQNVIGSTDIIQLVCDTVTQLCGIYDSINPISAELEKIKQGAFKIYRIDLNKALLFEDAQKAQQHLALIKEHGTYPRREREIKDNGIYFGLKSKRTTLLYYYKGKEICSHKKQQAKLTPELQAYADCMVRCEVRLYSQHLRDNELQYGYCWSDELVKQLVEDSHSKLNLPEPVSEIELPARYIRFLATQKQGSLPKAYTASTITRYKRDLAKQYGLVI